MGVYIGVDMIPNNIKQEEWEGVFEETLELIRAYPFATLNAENMGDYQRFVLDRTEVQEESQLGQREKYWKINGDLETKETGEGFKLSANLENYLQLKEKALKEDILFYQTNNSTQRASQVFYAKTQGLPYHLPLLAIVSLIESRFPQYACVYGDITQEQAEKAVEWANAILEKPINLPVRVHPSKLLGRLKNLYTEEMQLEALYDLFIGASDVIDSQVAKHFSIESVSQYFAKELGQFSSATQLGAELLMIKSLNSGLPLENLTAICCFDSNGPRFDPLEFTKAICSTWVMIAPEIRGNINLLNNSPETPDTVESQFGSIFLDMGFIGRKTKRFISKNKVLEVLQSKFPDNSKIGEIIESNYEENVRMLEGQGRKLKEIEEELHTEMEENIVSTFEDLLFWDETKVISEGIIEVLIAIKDSTNNSIAETDSQVMQMIGGLEKGPLIKLISKLTQEHHHLILTRNAWEWIEAEDNDSLKRMVILLFALENKGSATKLYKAIFENKGLFYMYLR